MNGKPEPTQNFLVSAISGALSSLLRPALYVMRSHMGIQHTALIPIIVSAVFYGAGFWWLSTLDEVNEKIAILYLVLIVVGYLRNCFQARHRRRTRDWSVSTWSTGESLFVPVFRFLCPRIYSRWGHIPSVGYWVRKALTNDFVYYVAEPAALLLASAAMWSIGSEMFRYPILLAFICVVVRNDAQLWLYLKAHEIPDGKKLERAINTEFEDPSQRGLTTASAEIPDSCFVPVETDDSSVFDRLSPELQTVLMKDRFAHGEPLR
jgi:hypothetical protein